MPGAGNPGAGMPGAGNPGAGNPGAGMPMHDYQDQAPDYSKNKNYQTGMREGQADQAHNRDHSKKHHFKHDEDLRAYEAGYQKGHGN
jgi:hypothetical protein